MHARRAAGNPPGRRGDKHKLGLAVEGGGMRGIVSCAMLSALEDFGYGQEFDAIYGGSSGSVNAAYFLAGDLWRSLSIYYDDLASRRFINLRRVLRRGAPLDVDFAFEEVFALTKPLDAAAVLRSPVPLHVAIALVDEQRTIWPSEFESPSELMSALRAGSWLPVAATGTATFRGRRAIDGGALISHPSRIALADGCTHVLSLSTRPAHHRRNRPDLLQRYAAARLGALSPGFRELYLEGDRIGQADRRRLDGWRTDPLPEPAVLDLCPISDRRVSRHDIDTGRLQAAARDAYEVMAWALTGVFERAYPRLMTATREAARRPAK